MNENSGPHKSLTLLSLRAFAREIGVSEKAVRKAIQAGRIRKSLGKTGSGRPAIVDVELAKQEWATTSRTSVGTMRTTESPQESAKPAFGTLVDAETLAEAQRLATIQRERKLRLENDVTEGRLVSVDRLKKEAFEAERIVRESILNLPARVAGELHAEKDFAKFYVRFEAVLREALSVASDTLVATAHG